jgi:hypothetical protein
VDKWILLPVTGSVSYAHLWVPSRGEEICAIKKNILLVSGRYDTEYGTKNTKSMKGNPNE